MLLMYLLSITAAEDTIDLSASYFVPDDLTRAGAPRRALERGVRVRIIVPGEHIDTEVVRRASRAQWGALLKAGAEIHEYQPDDVPLQDADRRSAHGLRRFHQLRQPVVPPER